MSNVNMEGLPPEMQARIASIIEGAKQKVSEAPVPQQPAAPVAPQPTLMDHVIALRQEVAALRSEVNAVGQVTEAVGQAVGSMYQMFQAQTEPSNCSTKFQATVPQPQVDEDY